MTSNHGSGSGSNDAPVASDPNREGLNASARGSPQEKRPGIVRRLYDWVLSWADTPYGPIALALIAVAEASFFPIPPDVLLIALVLGRPDRYLVLAANSTISSVLGGLAGYAIGVFFMDSLGMPIIEFYGKQGAFSTLQAQFQQVAFLSIFAAGLTPIPYKVFTIAAGACKLDIAVFFTASVLSRGLRFFVVASLLKAFGPSIKIFIDKYFNILSVVFTIVLIGGFAVVKFLLR